MIVYGNRVRSVNPAQQLQALASRGGDDGSDVRDLLIDFGALESAVVDALCPARDDATPLIRAFRQASLVLGRAFLAAEGTSRREPPPAQALQALTKLELPESVNVSTPEGYAFYGVYPEAYAEAARRFLRERRPAGVVAIGIRSIGASLSAVVAAVLEQNGCLEDFCTVRPRGHPFDRYLDLSPQLESNWRARRDLHFLVVDEGPGLSGSSFASTARALCRIGVDDTRIALLPSWMPDGDALLSASAREHWKRHPKYPAEFDPRTLLDGRGFRDFSAGRWRALFYRNGHDSPAVQPQHERIKYFCQGARLWKFEGLGSFGRRKFDRARQLAAAGFSPPPVNFEEGFLSMELVDGRPVRSASTALLDTMARYAAHLKRHFPSSRPVPFSELLHMLATNAGEGLGAEWAGCAALFEKHASAVADGATTETDGRMLPHEWLAAARGYVKTDSLDHHDDHFFPGCQDVLWDLAGASIEFCLDAHAERYLVEQYVSQANDPGASARLPFYRAAYAAWRMAYCDLAARTLSQGPDAQKFRRLRTRYRNCLAREIRS